MTNDVYLAGLWRRHLPYHLLWATNHRYTPKSREDGGYVAPSWSWASKTKAIEPYVLIRPDNPALIQIISASTIPATSSTLGQVLDGHIELRGWLRKFRVVIPKPREELFHGPTVSSTVEFDEILTEGERDVWFLPVISLGSWVALQVLGLLLEETSRKGEFRRVGRFRASENVAKKFFRRPAYPLESDNGRASAVYKYPEGKLDSRKKRGWFGAKTKTDHGGVWKERIITII